MDGYHVKGSRVIFWGEEPGKATPYTEQVLHGVFIFQHVV